MGELWFVTGGARSGKSSFAKRLAAGSGRPVIFIATMEPLDDELRRRVERHRVERHRAERPAAWATVEAPRDPVAALRAADPGACALLDCLSLWVSNRLLEAGEEPSLDALAALDAALAAEADALLAVVTVRAGETIVVTNEVGASVVPNSALGRAYRDLLGSVNQRVAARASRAWILVAGRALELPPAEETP